MIETNDWVAAMPVLTLLFLATSIILSILRIRKELKDLKISQWRQAIAKRLGNLSRSTKMLLFSLGCFAASSLLTALLFQIQESTYNQRVASISTVHGWRLVCGGECTPQQVKAAHACYQEALAASDKVSHEGLSVQLTRAMTHWRGCLRGEDIALEKCNLDEPDCDYSDKPFLLQYIGSEFTYKSLFLRELD